MKTHYTLKKWKWLFAFFLLIYWQQSKATIYYVDGSKTDNTGAGTSWATAKKDISAALTLTIVGGTDEIWVKAGTYYPTVDPFGNSNPTDPRDKTFYLKDGVKFYGGFAGDRKSVV